MYFATLTTIIHRNFYHTLSLTRTTRTMTTTTPTATFDEFTKIDLRVGRIIEVNPFPEARNPAWKLKVDFGEEIGIKKSSAQITNYAAEELVGTLVMAVVNFKPRQVGKFMSEVLVVGVPDSDGKVILVRPDKNVPVGGRLH
ncbi:hypothetical protein BC943DRAFT_316648 [Umbelopsis sp. AD052]|nr:hypothetical protein BC943DRAFT_316648 [Umbelopsis sp. AD052]